MKKLVKSILVAVSVVMASGALYATATTVSDAPNELCVPGAPCVYDGKAWTENNMNYLQIQVYSSHGSFVARFTWINEIKEVYCIKTGPTKYYFNWNDTKYFFEM